jgi:hypothetical protein
MSTQKPFLYQPEDLERLLRTKTFNGLLPEERAFVLQHVSNEEEFNELKMLLGKIESSEHEMQDPPAAVWKNLKKEFNAHKPSRFKVWLNFLFPPLPKWNGSCDWSNRMVPSFREKFQSIGKRNPRIKRQRSFIS